MTIKCLLYFDILYPEYKDIIISIRKVKNLEIINFICSLNTQLSIEGLVQFNGSIASAIQQTKCDTIIVFTLANDFIDIISKICSTSNRIYLILIPLSLNIDALEKLSNLTNITVNTCLPIRHLLTIWKAYKKLNIDPKCEPLQFIEAKLISPVLKTTNPVYGSSLEYDINLNNFYQLLTIDALQFISQRIVMKVQAFSKSIASECESNIKNEKHMHDYSIIMIHFKWKPCDIKKSSTSTSNNSLLPGRTALIKIKSTIPEADKMNFKIKIKSAIGLFDVDKNRFLIDDNDGETGELSTHDKLISDEPCKSFWFSPMFCQGMERFFKHIEIFRQQSTPRLVDLDTQNEDVNIAKSCLIELSQLIKLCKVVKIVNRAASTCQTLLIE